MVRFLVYLSLLASTPALPRAVGQSIFQGNSVIIVPSNTSRYPGDASYRASNFYCYATPRGYLSFGW